VLFSNSGNTAFELVHGFEGAEFGTATLHMYDTATRTLKKSLTLPFQPSDALMSPDGSTLYMIGLGPAGRIQILYYDLLSGTADLTVTLPSSVTFQAPYRMHPNGKIYGQATSFRAGDGLGGVAVYDPQTRKIVSRFDVGLPFGLFINKMEFSPDGLQLYVLDTASIATANRPAAPGNVYLMDAITGHNFGSLPIGGRSSLFFVAPSLQ